MARAGAKSRLPRLGRRPRSTASTGPPRRSTASARSSRSHTVKYPYSFYALAKDVKDEDLKRRILAKVYRLTATN